MLYTINFIALFQNIIIVHHRNCDAYFFLNNIIEIGVNPKYIKEGKL